MMTVFANMMINSEERFEHLKDSFESFKDTSDDWLINIRGEKREEVVMWLKERLGNRATFFELLDERRGWTVNSAEMVKNAKYQYVLFWLEDHLNIAPQAHLMAVVEEMVQKKVDYLQYSWWQNGRYRRQYDILDLEVGRTIDVVTIGYPQWKKMQIAGRDVFLVTLLGIFEKNFALRILAHDRYMLPPLVRLWVFRSMTLLQRLGASFDQKSVYRRINRVLWFKLRRQPKETPHDFEKNIDRFDVLPIRTAIPHAELFACMDDDDEPANRSSLMSRGLYPIRERLISWEGNPPRGYISNVEVLKKGSTKTEAHGFFSSKNVRHVLTREYLRVLQGKISIVVAGEKLELSKGQGGSFFANLPHEVSVLEDSQIEYFKANTGLAPYNLLA